jgi:TP901-1 family phage major tail protein
MADKVQGKNIILYKTVGATNTAFACSTNCTFNVQVSQKDVTSQSSAWFNEYKIDVATWNVTCDGIVTLTGYSYADMLNTQLSRSTINIKFSIDNGSSGFVVLSGTAIITSITLNAPYKDISTYSVALQGVGAYTIS